MFLVVVYRDTGLPAALASVHSKVTIIRPDFFAMIILPHTSMVDFCASHEYGRGKLSKVSLNIKGDPGEKFGFFRFDVTGNVGGGGSGRALLE